MNAIEFTAKVDNDNISIPDNVKQLLQGQNVKVIVLYDNQSDDASFENLAQQQFSDSYADEDAMYDNYPE